MGNYAATIFEHNMPLGSATVIVDEAGARCTSWEELYKKSCSVAAYASSVGLKGVVPVCMPRSMETVAVMLGLGLAGIGVAPLAYSAPALRVAAIEEQTDNKAWTYERYEAAMQSRCNSFDPVDFGPDGIAYVVFTSGSTGTPKGVMLSSDVVVKAYKRIASEEFLDLRTGDITLQLTSFAFVAILANLLAPLYMGCTTHILSDEALLEAQSIADYINDHGITSAVIVPKILRNLPDVPSLRVVCTGSEKITDIGPRGYKLINAWGMSETGAFATRYEIQKPMEKTPIGTSWGDFDCYIVDDDGNLANEGELCLSGAISQGYYKRPDLTQKVFTPNPFSQKPGHEVLLHTGDIVRALDDGNLLYINRKDFMIKINGQRVEPGEAETIVKRIDGVKAAAVKGFTDESGRGFMCAYYVSDGTVTEDKLRHALEQELPSYMIPSFYIECDSLATNANGKLDYTQLQAPQASKFHTVWNLDACGA